MAAVSLKNICKIYDGGVKAVDNVNIEIEDKEFVKNFKKSFMILSVIFQF